MLFKTTFAFVAFSLVVSFAMMSFSGDEGLPDIEDYDSLDFDYLDENAQQKSLDRAQRLQTIIHPQPLDFSNTLGNDAIRKLHINFDEPEDARYSNALLIHIASEGSGNLASKIESLEVTGSATLGNWTALATVIASAENLREVRWKAGKALTPDILSLIDAKHETVKLHFTPNFGVWDPYALDYVPIRAAGEEHNHDSHSKARESVIGSKALVSLDAAITYGGQTNTEDMLLMSRMLTSCPSLRELKLYFYHEGCVFRGSTPQAFDFNIHGDIPPLESVKLYRYNFGADHDGHDVHRSSRMDRENTVLRWPWNMLPHRLVELVPEYQIQEYNGVISYHANPDTSQVNNIETWLKRMDWSHVHTLSLSSILGVTSSSMAKLGKAMTEVKSVVLQDLRDPENYLKFLQNLDHGLEDVHLCGVNSRPLDQLIEALRPHRDTLRSYDIHWSLPWRERPGEPSIYIGIEYLQPLAKTLPETTKHAALPGPKDWDAWAIDVLGSISNLEDLHLHVTDSSLPRPSPRKQLQNDKFWSVYKAWTVRYEPQDDSFESRYNTKSYPDDMFMLSAPITDEHPQDIVLELFNRLRAVKQGKPLCQMSIYMGPWDVPDSTRRSQSGHCYTSRVWEVTVLEQGREECKGFDIMTTKSYHGAVWKETSWAEAIDQWVVDTYSGLFAGKNRSKGFNAYTAN